jgi:predicted short-subunit dehydrogenase-like oxidoreductase (DUF2520 family)
MRELERTPTATPPSADPRIALIGPGRLGSALAPALRAAGFAVTGPLGRGTPPAADVVLLCVPDGEIAGAAAAVAGSAPLVGHTSGATPLSALDGAGAEAFALHPLQTFTAAGGTFAGCGCAIGGATPRALATATAIARRLGMRPFELSDEDRPAYHAAASIASNFLVTIEAAAERVAAGAGLDRAHARELLAPLVRTTVENWAAHGPERALTGPVARGDDMTVARQRAAVVATAPELEPLFDALVEATSALAGAREAVA